MRDVDAASRAVRILGAAALLIAGAPPPDVDAEVAKERSIEEIVVTAQRKEQAVQEVPISISVLNGEFLKEQNVTDLVDITRYVPNLRIVEQGSVVQSWIRGFGTDAFNLGFDQAVGIVVDEVPYGRSQYLQVGFLDVDRVEVLRGPQGQLFGRNTTVGLFNLTTAEPSDELTGSIGVEFGELDRQHAEIGIGGPLIRGIVNVRVAGLVDRRDGYMENTTRALVPDADDPLQSRDRKGGRIKLAFPDLLGGDLRLSYEHHEMEIEGFARELTIVPAKYRPLFLLFDPQTDFEPENYVSSLDAPSFRTSKIDTFVAKDSREIGGWAVDTLFGWSRLDTKSELDTDGSPFLDLNYGLDEIGEQTTAELRMTSPNLAGLLGLPSLLGVSLGESDFTAGVFFQRRVQDPAVNRLHINSAVVGTILALSGVPSDMGSLLGDLPVPAGTPPDVSAFDELLTITGVQTANSYAGFGQMDWRFAERWHLLYGMRLSYSEKRADFESTIDPASAVVIPLAAERFTAGGSHTEFHFTPKVGAKYDWSDDLNLYATWATSFREGGFSGAPVIADLSVARFDPETVESWEIGTKMRLLDGAADLGLAAFWMTLENFQLQTIQPGSFVPEPEIINAGLLRARGVEADFSWLPADWLTLRGGLGFNDNEYRDFRFGTCSQDRPDTDGDGDARCDLTGRSVDNAPKWTISLTPSVRIPLMYGVDLTGAVTTQFIDTHYLWVTVDPRTREQSHFLVNGTLGLACETQGWSLGVTVENMTDETVSVGAGEVPRMNGAFNRVYAPPRLVFAGARWSF